MNVTLVSNWTRADQEVPPTRGFVSQPLLIVHMGKVYSGHFHSNNCFYVADGLNGHTTLLGCIDPQPRRGEFSGSLVPQIDPKEVLWTYADETTAIRQSPEPTAARWKQAAKLWRHIAFKTEAARQQTCKELRDKWLAAEARGKEQAPK